MYYGLFIKIGRRFVRVDTTTGYTLETAKVKFRNLTEVLMEKGIQYYFRALPPVKQIDVMAADKKYARTPW